MPTRLLLADDSVTVQRVIELTFAEEGVEVTSVGDGAQAIARVDQDRPDIVLADISMPGRDGYEVAAHLKNTPELAHIPVVLMTGAFEQLDEARAGLVRCDAVLAKPFEPHMVIATGSPISSVSLRPTGRSSRSFRVGCFSPGASRTSAGFWASSRRSWKPWPKRASDGPAGVRLRQERA